MRVLLHACCGPCFLEPYEAIAAGHDVDVAFVNPNIHPLEEYRRRRDALSAHLEERGIRWREVAYDPARWMRTVAGYEDDRTRRCPACFELRLEMLAEIAEREGYEAIATTLTVSPYQDLDAVREAGARAAGRHGLEFIGDDFRRRYGKAAQRSKELGMYRQRYCGCLLSELEAARAREGDAGG